MSNAGEMTGREYLGFLFVRGLLGLAIAGALIYAVDAGVLRLRVATDHGAFGTVTVHPYYAMDRKDKKTEFLYGEASEETCVNSLFPHLGDSPCWWVTRHKDEEVGN